MSWLEANKIGCAEVCGRERGERIDSEGGPYKTSDSR